MRLLLLAVTLLGSFAFAGGPKLVSMPLGQTTTLSMPAPVSTVQVANPELLQVTRKGRDVVLVGRSTGATEITVKTIDGDVTLRVYVAADKYGLPN